MSKKYFINNLDTDFGQAFIRELVKEPTEDPTHMCTVRVPADAKPQGIKKILKREKPKLFRKKAIEECEVYIYNVDQTQIADIQFGIEMMQKPFQENKVFILVSDIMSWSNSGKKIKKQAPPPPPEEGGQIPVENVAKPEEQIEKSNHEDSKSEQNGEKDEEQEIEEKPIEYTFFEDIDYESRIPLERYKYLKQIEDKVLAIKRQNVKIFIVCPGVIYGCGEDTFYSLFKAAWLQQPDKLPYLNEGHNKIPTIHLKDLVKFIIKIAESPPQASPYILAFDQTENKTQKSIIQAISSGIGSGKISSVENTALIENSDKYLIDLDIKSSKALIGTVEEPVEFQWTARKGIHQNIKSLLKDFCQKQKLRPLKILLLQNNFEWKQSKIQFILKTFSEYYKIPVLSIKKILQNAKQLGDEQLANDIREEWQHLMDYLNEEGPKDGLDETMKVFYRAVRWRLNQNDCTNRGYILENFPKFTPELNYIFNKISLNKLKRKKLKKEAPKVTEKKIGSEGDLEEQNGEEQKQEAKEQVKQQEPPVEEEQVEGEVEGEEGASKYQDYYPESVISIKQMGSDSVEEVIDFFTSRGMEELAYDSTNQKEHEIFQSLRSHIERNGRPNNYLISEEELLEKHKKFTTEQNHLSLEKREKEKKHQEQIKSDQETQRNKLAQDMFDIVRGEGEEEIKKMPFRNYLMEFVVPTLNMGLLEVSNIIPNDPVDLLAEYLYQKSYDV